LKASLFEKKVGCRKNSGHFWKNGQLLKKSKVFAALPIQMPPLRV